MANEVFDQKFFGSGMVIGISYVQILSVIFEYPQFESRLRIVEVLEINDSRSINLFLHVEQMLKARSTISRIATGIIGCVHLRMVVDLCDIVIFPGVGAGLRLAPFRF